MFLRISITSYSGPAPEAVASASQAGPVPVRTIRASTEHGQKVQQAIRQHGESPQVYVDRLAEQWQATWDDLHIAYDDFIRTTETRHVQVVQEMLQQLWEQSQI